MADARRRQVWLGSMRLRILATVIGLLVLSSIGSILTMRAVLFERLEEEVQLDLNQEAEEFRLLSSGNDPATGEPFDADLRAIFDVYFAREVPDEGETLLAFVDGRLYESRRAQDAAGVGELDSAIAYWLSVDETDRGDIETPVGTARYVAVPLAGAGSKAVFVVANFPQFERDEIDDAVRTQIAVQLGTIVLASLIGVAVAGRVLRPLRSLAKTAQGISDSDLTQRIPVTGRDEASQIAVAFNDMVTRLESAITDQRQFLDDASHELRTPLTVVRGHVELLVLDETPAERRSTIMLVTDEIDRMARVVEDLFLLARADQPDFVHPQPLDLRRVVLDAHRKATALAHRDWQVDASVEVPILGDEQRLTQAILQLADNAAKFTSEGETIRLGAATDGGWARMWVHDSGSGVAPAAAARIFERFNRGTQVRGSVRGAGLGLTIVLAIAEAHGGTLRLVPHRGRGAWFEVRIPAAAPGRRA